jgi:hypothetical protein
MNDACFIVRDATEQALGSRSTNLPSSLPQLLSATVAGGASGLSVVVTCGAVASSGFAAAGWVVDWSVALATITGVALAA